jgi:hypothetical protein
LALRGKGERGKGKGFKSLIPFMGPTFSFKEPRQLGALLG